MGMVQRVTLANAFDATGKYVPEGHIGTFDDEKITEKDKHLVDPGSLPPGVMVQIAAISPTGPNPTMPQQIPADAVQGPGGNYMLPGKTLVAEVTRSQEQRIDDAGLGNDPDLENEVSEALRKIAQERGLTLATVGVAALGVTNNADAALLNNTGATTDGTVKEVTADLGGKTDDQLQAMLTAENDRQGGARVGVTKAIQSELDSRTSQQTT